MSIGVGELGRADGSDWWAAERPVAASKKNHNGRPGERHDGSGPHDNVRLAVGIKVPEDNPAGSFENVELPLTYRNMPSSDRKKRVLEALENPPTALTTIGTKVPPPSLMVSGFRF